MNSLENQTALLNDAPTKEKSLRFESLVMIFIPGKDMMFWTFEIGSSHGFCGVG